jgi:2-(1,2-epoxy-1,2-dihydrophenyl)acetyl-CoA isomerase
MREPDGSTAPVLVERRGALGVLTLNRPRWLNAMNDALMDDLREALVDLGSDDTIRCVVLRGNGRAFSAGGDVAMMAARRDGADPDETLAARIRREQANLIRRGEASLLLRSMTKPTIAVLHGHVIGGAMALALAADLRIASTDTKLRIGFGARALSGDFGITYLLVHAVGDVKARELLLLDPLIDASTALSLGLVTSVHDPDDLDRMAAELGERLAAGPTVAYGRMKSNLEHVTAGASFERALHIEAMNQRVSALSEDCAESGRAFAEKREPKFIGG